MNKTKIIRGIILGFCTTIMTGCTFMHNYEMALKNTGLVELNQVKVSSGELYQTFGVLVVDATSGGGTPIPMTKGRKLDIYWEINRRPIEKSVVLPKTVDRKNNEYVQISIDGEEITGIEYLRLPDW